MKLKLLALVLLFSSAVGFVHGGESSGGGGNSSAGEFMMIATWTLNTLSQRGEIQINNRIVDVSAMSRLVAQAKIQPTDEKLILNGTPVSAINYPNQKRIIFNQDTWDSLDRRSKIQLCLHEFWGLAFSDHQDDNYAFSSALVDIISAVSFENPSQIVSAQSTDMDLNGYMFRAMVTKNKIKDQDGYQIIFEKIADLPRVGGIITSHIVYSSAEFSVRSKWGIQNLRIGQRGFEFDLNYFLPNQVTCLFPLPKAPVGDIELKKIEIGCHNSTPGNIGPF